MPWSALTLPKEPISRRIPVRLPDRNVPDGGLPSWYLLPNDGKLPLPHCPREDLVLSYRQVGKSRYQHSTSRDFDLSDPLGKDYPSLQYKPLNDPNLRDFFLNTKRFKRLVQQGEITADGRVKCTLAEYNEYRRYLYKLWDLEVSWLTKTQLLNEKILMQSQLDEFLEPVKIKIPEDYGYELRRWERRLFGISAKGKSPGIKVFHDVPDHHRICEPPVSVDIANERLNEFHTELEKEYQKDYPAVAEWLHETTRGYRNFKERQLDDRKIKERKVCENFNRRREHSIEFVEKDLKIRHKERVLERKLKNKRHNNYHQIWDKHDRALAKNMKRRKSIVQHECDRVEKLIMDFRARRGRGLDNEEHESLWDTKQTIRSTLEMLQGSKARKGKKQDDGIAKKRKQKKVRFEDKATMTEVVLYEEPAEMLHRVESEDHIMKEKPCELQEFEPEDHIMEEPSESQEFEPEDHIMEEETSESQEFETEDNHCQEDYITLLDNKYKIASMTVNKIVSVIEEHLQQMLFLDLDASTSISSSVTDSSDDLNKHTHDEDSKLPESTKVDTSEVESQNSSEEIQTIPASPNAANLSEVITDAETKDCIQSILNKVQHSEKMEHEKKDIVTVVNSLLDYADSAEAAKKQAEITTHKNFIVNETEIKGCMQFILDEVNSIESLRRRQEKVQQVKIVEVIAVMKSLLDNVDSRENERKQAEIMAQMKQIRGNTKLILGKISDTEHVLQTDKESIESLLYANLSSLQKLGYTDTDFLLVHKKRDVLSILDILKQMSELVIEKSTGRNFLKFEKQEQIITLDEVNQRILQYCEKADHEKEVKYLKEIKSFFYTNILEPAEKAVNKASTANREFDIVPPKKPKDESNKESWDTIKVLAVPDEEINDSENLENEVNSKEKVNSRITDDDAASGRHDKSTPKAIEKKEDIDDGITQSDTEYMLQEEGSTLSTATDAAGTNQNISEENIDLTMKLGKNAQDENVSNIEKSYSAENESHIQFTTQIREKESNLAQNKVETQVTQKINTSPEDGSENDSEQQKEKKKSDNKEYIVNYCECFYYMQLQNNNNSKHLVELKDYVPNNGLIRTLFYKLHQTWHTTKAINIMPGLKECNNQFKSNGTEEPHNLTVLKLNSWDKFQKDIDDSITASDCFKFSKDNKKQNEPNNCMIIRSTKFQEETAFKDCCLLSEHSKTRNVKAINKPQNKGTELKLSLGQFMTEKQTLPFKGTEINSLHHSNLSLNSHRMSNSLTPNKLHILNNNTENETKVVSKLNNIKKPEVANCNFCHPNYHNYTFNPPRNGGWTLKTHWKKNAGDLLDLEYKEMALKMRLRNKKIKPLKAKEQLMDLPTSTSKTLSAAEKEQLKYIVRENFIHLSLIDSNRRYSKTQLLSAMTDSETSINLSEDSLEDLYKDTAKKRDENFMWKCSDMLRADMNQLRTDIFNGGREKTFEQIAENKISLKQANNEVHAIILNFAAAMSPESHFKVSSSEQLKDPKSETSFQDHTQSLAFPVNAQFNITIKPGKPALLTASDDVMTQNENHKEQPEVISYTEVINLPFRSTIPIHHTSKFSKTVRSKRIRFSCVGTVNIAVNPNTPCHYNKVEKIADTKGTATVENSNLVQSSEEEEQKNITNDSLEDPTANAELNSSEKPNELTVEDGTRESIFSQPTGIHSTSYINHICSFPETMKTRKSQRLDGTLIQEEISKNVPVQSHKHVTLEMKDTLSSSPHSSSPSTDLQLKEPEKAPVQEGIIKHLPQKLKDICYILPKTPKSDTSVGHQLTEIDDVCEERTELVTVKHNELFFSEMDVYTKEQQVHEQEYGNIKQEQEEPLEIHGLTPFKVADLELINVCSIMPTESGEFLQTSSFLDDKLLLSEDNSLPNDLNKKYTPQDLHSEYLKSSEKESTHQTGIMDEILSEQENFDMQYNNMYFSNPKGQNKLTENNSEEMLAEADSISAHSPMPKPKHLDIPEQNEISVTKQKDCGVVQEIIAVPTKAYQQEEKSISHVETNAKIQHNNVDYICPTISSDEIIHKNSENVLPRANSGNQHLSSVPKKHGAIYMSKQ